MYAHGGARSSRKIDGVAAGRRRAGSRGISDPTSDCAVVYWRRAHAGTSLCQTDSGPGAGCPPLLHLLRYANFSAGAVVLLALFYDYVAAVTETYEGKETGRDRVVTG